MRLPLALFSTILLMAFTCAIGFAQTVTSDLPASISGRVTIAGKAAAGIGVIASTESSFDKRTVGKSTTDEEGNYRISGLPPGRLVISPVARAYITAGGPTSLRRALNVAAGEEITKIDFALSRGGVITGRITDSDGSPIIAESVTIIPLDKQSSGSEATVLSARAHTTDDRGIYRAYALAPGAYKVSVGQPKPERLSGLYRNGSQYLKTFYPSVIEEEKAAVIEVKEGTEAKDVDIQASKGARGFSVSGRVIDAISDQPAANVYVAYSSMENADQEMGSMSFSPVGTDVNGRFTLEGLQPGRYTTFTFGVGVETNSYSEPVKFEILDGDVSGVVIKLSKGITVSGVAVIENSADPTTNILQQASLYAYAEQKTRSAPSFSRSTIKADGSFKFTGLAPGKIRVTLGGFPAAPKGLTLSRIELAGVAQPGGFEATAGTDINDVRLIFSYGGGSLRGSINVAGGIPPGTTFVLILRAANSDSDRLTRAIDVDSRGRFVAEDLPVGTYELTLNARQTQRDLAGFTPIKQMISITADKETQVTFDVDLSGQKAGSN